MFPVIYLPEREAAPVVLHIARAIGWMHGKIAEGLLVRL